VSVIEQDIWDLKKSHIIVVPTNMRGVMGRGIAKQYADAYPAGALRYKHICQESWFEGGKPLPLISVRDCDAIMLPVKNHWRDMASPEMIRTGLFNLITFTRLYFEKTKKKRIAVPLLGGGFGGLETKVSVGLIVDTLGTPLTSDWYDLLRPLHSELALKYPKSFVPGARSDKSKEK
jgi:hypothetical protein